MKKSDLKLIIRKIVREEVAMAIQEVITELKQPTQQVSQPKTKKKMVEKKRFQSSDRHQISSTFHRFDSSHTVNTLTSIAANPWLFRNHPVTIMPVSSGC